MRTVKSYSNNILESLFIWNLLAKWAPPFEETRQSELAEDLFVRLQKHLPDVPVSRQTEPGKGFVSITIQESFRIVVQPAFAASGKTELDRRMGEIERDMKEWVDSGRGPAYLVIVGALEPEIRAALENAVDRLDSGYLTEWFFLMVKEPAAGL